MHWLRSFGGQPRDRNWVVVHQINANHQPGQKVAGILLGMDKFGISVETSERDMYFIPWHNVSDVHAEREVIDK